jgi:hypothetical protein
VRCGAVDRSSCRCLFVRRPWFAGYGDYPDKEGGQSYETRLDQSGIAFCSAGEEVSLGVSFCGWRGCLGGGCLLRCLGLRAEDVDVMSLSSAQCVRENQSSYQ